jgi:uncharacterized membrane protein
MIRVDLSIDISAPVEEVFSYSTNNENDPIWMEEVVKVEKTSEGPIGVGSTFVNHVEFLGKSIEDSHEIIEYESNKRMTIVQRTGAVPFKAIYLYEFLEGGTRFTMQIEAEPGGFFKLAAPLVRRQLETQFERNLKNLKSILEKQDE